MPKVFVASIDPQRRGPLLTALARFEGFDVHFQGVVGSALADSVCLRLVERENWVRNKGTLGCFLSHVLFWEKVAQLEDLYAIILEDDAAIGDLSALEGLDFPEDMELLYLQDKLSPGATMHEALRILPLIDGLRKLETLRIGCGCYGYLLTPHGARKLVEACTKDLFFGHVDGRLLRYSATQQDLDALGAESFIRLVIETHHSQVRMPELGIITSYCCSHPLVWHMNIDSVRDQMDDEGNA